MPAADAALPNGKPTAEGGAELRPDLAVSCRRRADGLTWTFRLKPGLVGTRRQRVGAGVAPAEQDSPWRFELEVAAADGTPLMSSVNSPLGRGSRRPGREAAVNDPGSLVLNGLSGVTRHRRPAGATLIPSKFVQMENGAISQLAGRGRPVRRIGGLAKADSPRGTGARRGASRHPLYAQMRYLQSMLRSSCWTTTSSPLMVMWATSCTRRLFPGPGPISRKLFT